MKHNLTMTLLKNEQNGFNISFPDFEDILIKNVETSSIDEAFLQGEVFLKEILSRKKEENKFLILPEKHNFSINDFPKNTIITNVTLDFEK